VTTTAFALGSFETAGRSFPGLVRDGRVADLEPLAARLGLVGPITTRRLLEDWDRVLPAMAEYQDEAADWWDLDSLRVLPPVEPRQVLQSGANYRTHVIDLAVAHRELAGGRTEEQIRVETGAMMDRRTVDGSPYLFLGLPSAIAGPYDDVVLPAYSDQHDWELELAAVIGRSGFRLHRDAALDHVAGYTIANDLTTRDLVFRRDMKEIGTDWYRSKNAPGFLPLGPYLVPSAFVADPMDLRVRLSLNGRVMQDESTKDMIFDVAALVAAASQITRLLPGDLVLTGSPAGNGAHWGRLLRDGDVMEGSITGLGVQRTACIAEVTR
jgi:2-keto-4-pentenoate hydratase/2-oxohepta-3-ene-1,7-dioic acid hydratase in catechol pathway